MIKKILVSMGVIFIVFVVLSAILVSLGGAHQKSQTKAPSGYPGLDYLTMEKGGVDRMEESNYGEPKESTRLVIRNGTIYMVVENINASVESIIKYTESKNGWVVNSKVTEREKIPSGSTTIRVPIEVFDEAMTYFKELSKKVSYEGTQGRDVTEEYTDLQSRLRNLEAAETQLLEIMERSGTISNILAVQRELTNVRSQIEQTKGRIQYLEENAEMATITINLALSEELLPIPPSEKWRPTYVVKQAWRSLLVFLKSISYFLIWIVVYAIIWVPLGIIIWRMRKFCNKRKRS